MYKLVLILLEIFLKFVEERKMGTQPQWKNGISDSRSGITTILISELWLKVVLPLSLLPYCLSLYLDNLHFHPPKISVFNFVAANSLFHYHVYLDWFIIFWICILQNVLKAFLFFLSLDLEPTSSLNKSHLPLYSEFLAVKPVLLTWSFPPSQLWMGFFSLCKGLDWGHNAVLCVQHCVKTFCASCVSFSSAWDVSTVVTVSQTGWRHWPKVTLLKSRSWIWMHTIKLIY